ncbi:putative GDP/GTP exchange factor Sec2p [Lyophyllum shimeji]|uniref:GDP/GTP exchange factor Sec2p n=1 Tax=Lyophyllum shimeji TaxID=47721 RepID=A0A9P3UQX3_LYOSH|nr:putative GDP/GTP exchange factor Sec2p [Lyophyllum shimeji]
MAEAPQEAHAEHKENGALEGNSETEQVLDNPKINGTDSVPNGTTPHDKYYRDPDAQDMVIASLRAQIQDLFSQVTELNGKLVKSYDRVSDLEDDLHMASATIRSSSLKISQLELERTQHLSALNTGLLVEKSHVTAELNRLMEKATEEAAQRGQAESARRDIEKDLDNLSADLFGQANTMVAEARYAKHLSEQKLSEAERALKGAEEAVGVMQQQMQALQAEKDEAERKAEEALLAMGKGKYKERRASTNPTRSIRLLSSHLPYQEFLLFVAHLRSVHPSSPQPPAMSTLLPLPFVARLLTEDSEPTVRLDLAPSLNWLSRRSVLSAIHTGQLTIEPMSSAALLQESTSSGLNASSSNISCALCGAPIFSALEAGHTHSRPQPPLLGQSASNSMSWSTSLFRKPSHSMSYSISSNSQPPTPTSRSNSQTFHQGIPPQVHIFRVASQSSSASSLPVSSLPRNTASVASSSASSSQTDYSSHIPSSAAQSSTIYPLCTSNWCLARLRTTCTLWAFVRTGIVEKIWEEEVPTLPATIATQAAGEKPPIPPRRRGIWGMASALSERATSWGEGDKDKPKRAAPAPPPSHPESKPAERRRLPPPPPPTAPVPTTAQHSVPPPLPKRSEVRHPPAATEKEQGKPLPEVETTAAPTTAQEHASSTQESLVPPRPPRRPITPASVPLPESRPHTPVAIAIPPSAAPAAVHSVAPGSPAPPPLPRRAAARAARTPGEAAGSRPATPAPPAAVTEPIVESKTDERIKDVKVEEVPKGEGEQTVSPTHGEASQEWVAPSTGEAAEPASAPVEAEKAAPGVETSPPESEGHENDVFVDAEATLNWGAVEMEEKKVDHQADSTEGKEKAEDAAGAVEPVTEAAEALKSSEAEVVPSQGAEEDAKGEEKKDETKEAVDEEPVVVTTPDKEKPAMSLEDVRADDDRDTKAEGDKEAYVGDATWEERTWNQIVRLKEEMFWARIGALRQ